MSSGNDLENALKTLESGGVILYPTDTIWGLGCDATATGALEKIIRIKTKSAGSSFIILVDGPAMLEKYVEVIPDTARELIEVAANPVTVIYPRGKNLAEGILDEDGSVAIRVCRDEFCQRLIGRFCKPIVSTSANISGKPFPANFSEIDMAIKNAVDYIVKYRQAENMKKVPSPIIKIDDNGVFKIIRS
jgi:L-threonylcarbamoyladenylate synthase